EPGGERHLREHKIDSEQGQERSGRAAFLRDEGIPEGMLQPAGETAEDPEEQEVAEPRGDHRAGEERRRRDESPAHCGRWASVRRRRSPREVIRAAGRPRTRALRLSWGRGRTVGETPAGWREPWRRG